MKKIYAIGVALLTFGFVQAQNVDVTFQVDMSTQVPAAVISVAGSFQAAAGASGDWTPGETVLTDGDNDGVYDVTVNIPAGTYEYKFLNGDAWGTDEGVPGACQVNGNREVVVAGAMTIPVVCFASCDPCPSAIDTYDLTFKLDMSQQTVDPNGVHIAGDFQAAAGFPSDWDPASTELLDGDNDDIYEVTVTVPQGTYAYKFLNGNAWGNDEGIPMACAVNSNREIILPGNGDNNNDMNLPESTLAAFGLCPPTDTVVVTFQVDLTNVTPSDTVSIAGNLQTWAGNNDWTPGETQLVDMGNNIYEITINMPEGTYEYKFVNGPAWGFEESIPSGCATNNNRQLVITGNGDAFTNTDATQTEAFCFGECVAACPMQLPPVNVTFRVDITNEIPSANGIHIAGDFQTPAWQKDADEMTDADADGVFEFTTSIVPGEYQYKFINGNDDASEEDGDFVTMGCGIDNGVGGSNRLLDLVGLTNDTILPVFVYNTCTFSALSIDDPFATGASFTVYPNPFSDFAVIEFQNNDYEMYTITMTDVTGKVVKSYGNFSGQRLEISRENINSGIYFLTVMNSQKEARVSKLIVR